MWNLYMEYFLYDEYLAKYIKNIEYYYMNY